MATNHQRTPNHASTPVKATHDEAPRDQWDESTSRAGIPMPSPRFPHEIVGHREASADARLASTWSDVGAVPVRNPLHANALKVWPDATAIPRFGGRQALSKLVPNQAPSLPQEAKTAWPCLGKCGPIQRGAPGPRRPARSAAGALPRIPGFRKRSMSGSPATRASRGGDRRRVSHRPRGE